MTRGVYEGAKAKEISFPLGGIGTGCIGISGNGRLIDWEIFNRPNKRSLNGFSHFAVKAESDGELLDARVLHGDLGPPYTGEHVREGPLHSGYGFGPEPGTMAGMPHFAKTSFEGQFPIARLTFSDVRFPGNVALTAFNPFIPLNDADSSLPAAFFEADIENCSHRTIEYTVCLSVENPARSGKAAHRYFLLDVPGRAEAKFHVVQLSSTACGQDDPQYGDLAIGTDHPYASWQQYWYRGGWNDNLEMFWRDFARPGALRNRTYDGELPTHCRRDAASLAARVRLAPGAKERVRFVISWNYPNAFNYWNPDVTNPDVTNRTWKTYYATRFEDAVASARYALADWERLYGQTMLFKEALYSSTLPSGALDAVAANLSVLKSPTALRLTDGSFYGFEGCIADAGCCEGSCTHVWNYAYALPFLFPKLERSMRELDYEYNRRADGKMSFRLMLPPGRTASDFRACVDGQFGGVVKSYRDWKLSGDDEWLRSLWPAIKSSLEFAWSPTNEDRWDPDKTGVLHGRQHHTLDMELFGPNSWMTGFYLAALKAGAEMAACMDDPEAAVEYEELYRRGKRWTDRHLFNGEYYGQRIDLDDPSLLDAYDGGDSMLGTGSARTAYWNEEAQEIKYQIGEGCGIDQVAAQWHANLCGLGDIFDKDRRRTALRSLYQYNFKPSMRDEANVWRLFSLNDEAGLVVCTWPEGRRRPAVPLTYHSETMTGFEYQAAALMIQEGLVAEGVAVVKAVRDRYDGEKRNPWSEIECGSNYARSMASYSLLNAFSGFEFDMVRGHIGFQPKLADAGGDGDGDGAFSAFWSLDGGWGTFEMEPEELRLKVLYGGLSIRSLKLPGPGCRTVQEVVLSGGERQEFAAEGDLLRFCSPVKIVAGRSLVVQCRGAGPGGKNSRICE